MKRLSYLSLLLLLTSTLPLTNVAAVFADTPSLIITEVKVRNDTAGLDEFIELYNPGLESVSLSEYLIGYINTPTPTPDQQFTEAVIAAGLLPAGESFVLAKNELDLDLQGSKKSPFSSLSDSGGTLIIKDNNANVIDKFAWSSTESVALPPIVHQCTNSNVSCNLNRTQSFSRSKDLEENYELDFPSWQLGEPTPESATLLPLPVPDPEPEPEPEPEPTPDPTPDPTEAPPETLPIETQPPEPDTDTTPDVPTNLLPLQITELLPNPAPPASDSKDEFIELYNPNDQALNLVGYKLQSGSTFSYSHTFGATSLAAHEYRAFMVTETGNILSNSGGQVRLLDPDGVVVAQTNAYDDANDGDAWAMVSGAWQWTTTSTPHAVNALTLPILKVAATKAPAQKKTTAKAASTKKAATPKASTAKAKVASTKTTKPKTTAERQAYEEPEAGPQSIHPGILAGVGVITLVYAAYEYRQDAINRLHQFRRYRSLRREARAASAGR
ncbi:MAG: lamin tail domain-containing protein [Patescibacteria group bacterium]